MEHAPSGLLRHAVAEATSAGGAGVRMRDLIIRSDGFRGGQAPEHRRREESVLPANRIAVDDAGNLRPKVAAHDRCGLWLAIAGGVRGPHLVLRLRCCQDLRRTTASRTGTFYPFLGSGVASATAALAASRATTLVTEAPRKTASLRSA